MMADVPAPIVTALQDVPVLNAEGFVRVCSYCTPRPRIDALNLAYSCSHGICDRCVARYTETA